MGIIDKLRGTTGHQANSNVSHNKGLDAIHERVAAAKQRIDNLKNSTSSKHTTKLDTQEDTLILEPLKPSTPDPGPSKSTTLTTDQKNEILGLIKNRAQSDPSDIFNQQTLDGLVGEIASVTGDDPISYLKYDPNQTPYTGLAGQIYDQFKGEQKYDANGAPLGLSTDTLEHMYDFVSSLPVNKGIKEIQKDEIDFSDFKVGFSKQQSQDFDKELKRLQGIKDDTGATTAQIATIKQQKAQLSGVQSFFTTEKDFWEDESKVKYKDKDLEQVKSIYEKIGDLEKQYDESVEGDIHQPLSDIHKQLTAQKSQLAKIRGYETKQPAYNNPQALEEASFSEFKTDFYTKQDDALKKEQQKWVDKFKVNPNDKEAKTNILKITNERKQTADAKSFWSKEQSFWTKLGNAGFSTKNQDQIDKLTGQLSQLESDMDMALSDTGNNDSKSTKGSTDGKNSNTITRSQIPGLAKQIAGIQAQITKLHTGF